MLNVQYPFETRNLTFELCIIISQMKEEKFTCFDQNLHDLSFVLSLCAAAATRLGPFHCDILITSVYGITLQPLWVWKVKTTSVEDVYILILEPRIAYRSWVPNFLSFLGNVGMWLHMKEVGFTYLSFAPLSWNRTQVQLLIFRKGLYLTNQRSTCPSPKTV